MVFKYVFYNNHFSIVKLTQIYQYSVENKKLVHKLIKMPSLISKIND